VVEAVKLNDLYQEASRVTVIWLIQSFISNLGLESPDYLRIRFINYLQEKFCSFHLLPRSHLIMGFFPLGLSGTGSTITETTAGLLYQPRLMDDDECEAIGGMIGRGN
jgi:hypothetical protein